MEPGLFILKKLEKNMFFLNLMKIPSKFWSVSPTQGEFETGPLTSGLVPDR